MSIELEAYCTGRDNAAAGRLVYEGLPTNAGLSRAMARALCQAGFESERIARNIGRFPVLLDTGATRRAYWLVAPGAYQVTMTRDERPAMNSAGYANLGALARLKGESI